MNNEPFWEKWKTQIEVVTKLEIVWGKFLQTKKVWKAEKPRWNIREEYITETWEVRDGILSRC